MQQDVWKAGTRCRRIRLPLRPAMFLLALLLLPTDEAQAETLTLDRAFALAAANNPQIKAIRTRLGVGESGIRTAGARLNPRLQSDNGIMEKTYRLGLEQTFQLGGKRRRRVELAEARRDTLITEINASLLEMRADIRRAYTELYYAIERRRADEQILRNCLRLLEIARERRQAGDVSGLDVLQTEIPVLNAKNEWQMAAYRAVLARNALNGFLNQPLDAAVEIAPPNPEPVWTPQALPAPSVPGARQGTITRSDPDLPDLIERALGNRPELERNRRELEVARRQWMLAKADRTPDLTLGAGSGAVSNVPGQYTLNAYVTGSLELPVLNRQQGAIGEALALKSQLEQEREALRKRMALEVTNAYDAFRMNRERVALFQRELLPVARTVAEKSRRAFEEGKCSVLVPIEAQQAYMSTRLGYLQALVDAQNSIGDLEKAVGVGL